MDINDSNFEEAINSEKPVLIDFWAEWCGPCKKLSPILDEIMDETGLQVLKLNVDENQVSAAKYKVSSIPTMIVFQNGEALKTLVGAKPKHLLIKDLEQWIG